MSTVEDRLKRIVAEQLAVKIQEIKTTDTFIEDLGVDSVDAVELIMALEEEFEIDIPDEDTEGLTTIKAAVDYISSKS